MNEDTFWALIQHIDRDELDDDEEGAVDPLLERLEQLTLRDLASFQEHLAQRLYALDGRRFAEQARGPAGYDGWFLEARCYVVARGRDFYRRVLATPALMSEAGEHSCDILLRIASLAAIDLTDDDPRFPTTVDWATGSNRAQWE